MGNDTDFEIPVGNLACNKCGCSGKDPNGDHGCLICRGKGYCSLQDIDDYHKAYPDYCRTVCGIEHHIFTEEIAVTIEGVDVLLASIDDS